MGKRQQETGWKNVTDGQNVTNQVKEGGHNATSDNTRQQETGWKYVTDGQNVTNQIKEGAHDVTSDKTSILRQG
jgi:cold shock CspA family protein